MWSLLAHVAFINLKFKIVARAVLNLYARLNVFFSVRFKTVVDLKNTMSFVKASNKLIDFMVWFKNPLSKVAINFEFKLRS